MYSSLCTFEINDGRAGLIILSCFSVPFSKILDPPMVGRHGTFIGNVVTGRTPVVAMTRVIRVMRCQVCYARVLDFRRKFIEAAQRYNELSYKSIIAEAERMTALRNALICTILASAGMIGILVSYSLLVSSASSSSSLVDRTFPINAARL